MKTNSTLLCSLLLIGCIQAFGQAGKDGSRTISSSNAIFNRYTTLTSSVSAGSNRLVVANIADLAASAIPGASNNPYTTNALAYGDLVMIIKMQGASITTADNNTYGAITNYNGVGTYELKLVLSVSADTIMLCGGVANSFTVSSTERVQVIRIPRLINLTINAGASLTGMAWSSSRKGGVVAVESNGNIVVNGSIDASAIGFKGGTLDYDSDLPGVTVYSSTWASEGGEKGESIAGSQEDYDLLSGRFSRGAPANGGGGGNAHNAGGGGGANGSNGLPWTGFGNPVTGFNVYWNLESAGFASHVSSGGGRGGYSYGGEDMNAAIYGPGAPEWAGDSRQNVGGFGGRPLTYTSNTLFLGGGGGAGDNNNGSGFSGVTVSANGGNGGSQQFIYGESEGPGGGGGGGVIWLTGSPSISATVNGGLNGTTASTSLTEFIPNGATMGGSGALLTGNSFTASPPQICSVLPLNLVRFTVVQAAGNVMSAEWATRNELNMKMFEVEKSFDGKNWRSAGSKQPENRMENTGYALPVGALDQNTFFRLKMISMDGSVSYSAVHQVRTKKSSLAAYVNASTLVIETLLTGTKEVYIYSSTGQLTYRNASVNANSYPIDISRLSKGIYYLFVGNNQEKQQTSFMVR